MATKQYSKKNDTMKWMQIKQYGGKYEVSNRGDIRRIADGTIVVPYINHQGCLACSFDGLSRGKTIHRLVAELFLEKPRGANVVHHINHEKLDNRASNLAWVNAKENRDAYIEFRRKNKWFYHLGYHDTRPRNEPTVEVNPVTRPASLATKWGGEHTDTSHVKKQQLERLLGTIPDTTIGDIWVIR